jgi:hypothetical protein
VDQAFDAFFHFHERAIGDELGDLAAHAMADRVTGFDVFPRVVLKLLEAEGDALFLAIDLEDLDLDLLADAEHFGRMVEAAPGHVRDVEESVHAVEIDERTEVGDVLDDADDLVARGDAVEELLALFGALGLDDFAAGKDDVFALVVDLDDLELEHLADVLVEILRRDDVDLGAGEEGFDADVDHEAAFDDALDLAFDETAVLEDGVDLFPVLTVGGLLLGEHDHAFVVFEAFEEDFDLIADLDVFIFELVGGDGPFGLVADVDEDDLRFDFEDLAFDDGSFGELAERTCDQVCECSGCAHYVVTGCECLGGNRSQTSTPEAHGGLSSRKPKAPGQEGRHKRPFHRPWSLPAAVQRRWPWRVRWRC